MTTLTQNDLRKFSVPPGALTVWWLGQNSFLLKSPGGTIITIDPYLSNSCEEAVKPLGLDFSRQIPIPMAAGDLACVDMLVFTHSHLDHMDPETIKPYREAGGRGPYLAPCETWERLQTEIGVPRDQITMTWPNKICTIGDLTLRTTFAIGFGSDDMTHVGYLVSVADGPTFYFTGDTSFEDLVWMGVKDHKPDVMITVINGAFRNLGPAEAAKLAEQIQPKVVIPCHHDMFRSNTMAPQMLQTNLILLGLGERYRLLNHCDPYTYPTDT